MGHLAERDLSSLLSRKEVAHSIIDLLIVQGLEIHSERLQPRCLASVVLYEVQVVLPEVLLAEVVLLYGTDSCFSGKDAADQSWTDAACTNRIGEPCGIAADHVSIRHQAIVLVSHGDLPASGKIAIIAQWRHFFETIISGEPILQKRTQRFLASLLLNSEPDVHLVFALRE